jgi:hypothetical protein
MKIRSGIKVGNIGLYEQPAVVGSDTENPFGK